MRILISLMAAGALFLAGCQTQDPYSGEEKTSHATRGSIIGALGGAAIGALTNTSSGKQAARNALIGAGVGALAGGAVGYYMDEQEAKLRHELRGAGVSVSRVGNSIVLNMRSDILFDTGSDHVSDEFIPSLRAVGTVLEEYEQTIIEVNGYADTVGSTQFNQDLSERRARAVATVLIYEGRVMPERIVPQGFGETQLAVPTADGVNEPRNRRVEIRISPYTS
jgi:outer membrane protein OmpA-like peptidoglycan-associated protein